MNHGRRGGVEQSLLGAVFAPRAKCTRVRIGDFETRRGDFGALACQLVLRARREKRRIERCHHHSTISCQLRQPPKISASGFGRTECQMCLYTVGSNPAVLIVHKDQLAFWTYIIKELPEMDGVTAPRQLMVVGKFSRATVYPR